MTEEDRIGFGSIQIHKKVLADIAMSAIREIGGVDVVPLDAKGWILSLIGKRDPSGIEVFIDKENQVSLEIKIYVQYGINIPDIARQVQDSVRNAVQKTAEINLKDVHVNIQGIVTEKERGSQS